MIRVAMSNSCVFPSSAEHAFRLAAEAGFDGMEIMVTQDRRTRDVRRLRELGERYGVPVLSIHAPVLLFTQFVWGRDPRGKLERAAEAALELGASTVVAHPPFRWQFQYARTFERIVREVSTASGIEIAVENMFPWRVRGFGFQGYLPSDDPTDMDVDAMTLDVSHAALAGRDSMEFVSLMGERLRHVHLCDGTVALNEGKVFDEHLVPGRGTQPVAELLEHLARTDWHGTIAAEVHTQKARHGESALDMLRETVRFAREHLQSGRRAAKAAAAGSTSASGPAGAPGPDGARRPAADGADADQRARRAPEHDDRMSSADA